MPRLLLLLPTGTYRTDDFVKAAEKLNIDLTAASEEPSTFEKREPSRLLTLDLRNPQKAARQAKAFSLKFPIDAVIGVDDETNLVAAAIADALSLPHNGVSSASDTWNKFRMRQRLREADIPIPSFQLLSLSENPEKHSRTASFPCVLKPVNLSAGRGVIRADTPEDFIAAFQRIKKILAASPGIQTEPGESGILAETFIPGVEVAFEGFMDGGELRTLAIFDKPDPLDGPFFPETLYITPSRLSPEIQAEITRWVGKSAAALGIRTGPLHAELRVNPDGPWVIEVAARSIGGKCSRVLRFGTGSSLEELIIRQALGLKIHDFKRESASAGVLMLPVPSAGILNEIKGVEDARNIPGIREIDLSGHSGQTVAPLPEGHPAYLGFLFAGGPDPDSVEKSLREAGNRIRILITLED